MNHRTLAPVIALLVALLPVGALAQLNRTPAWRIVTSPRPVPLFYQATGVAIGGRGNIFLADSGNHRVEKLSPAGAVLAVWGSDVPGPLRLSGPHGIAVDPPGNIYLADNGIVKLSSSGRVLARWTDKGLSGISGLAAGHRAAIYALSLHPIRYTNLFDRMTVRKLSPTGRILASWVFPYLHPELDALRSVAIAVGPTGDVVLSIAGLKHCHDCDGTYHQVWTLSPAGKTLTRRDTPIGGAGLAVDSAGTVYLAAPGKVETFSPDGKPLASIGTAGCGPVQFGDDLHLAVGPRGTLYVADSQIAAIGPSSIPAPFRAGVLHALPPGSAPAALYGTCPGSAAKLFGQISGLALTPDGTVYVADEASGLIDRIAPNGTLAGFFPANHPAFVAADTEGNLYVPNLRTASLEKRSPIGVLLGRVSGLELEDVALDRSGRIYALSSDGMVSILRPIGSSQTLQVIRRWRLEGYPPHSGGLNPAGITLDGRNNVYVADTRHSRVQKFSPAGRLLAVWGRQPGSGPGQFRQPTGIAADGRGHVYILDRGNNRIEEFGTGGRFQRIWGREGQAPGQLSQVAGIAVDGQGNVYVGDSGNDRIQELVIRP